MPLHTAQIAAVEEMERLVGTGDWDRADDHFTGDVRYQVGSGSVFHGAAGIRRYMTWQNSVVRWEGHALRQRWNADDVVIIEVDSHFVRLGDGASVTVSCTDIYRMSGLRIRDWRVYADYTPFGAQIPAELMTDLDRGVATSEPARPDTVTSDTVTY